MDAKKQRLMKLLALTTSPNDHEALSALRHAQALMKELNLTWDTAWKPRQITVKKEHGFDYWTDTARYYHPTAASATAAESFDDMVREVREAMNRAAQPQWQNNIFETLSWDQLIECAINDPGLEDVVKEAFIESRIGWEKYSLFIKSLNEARARRSQKNPEQEAYAKKPKVEEKFEEPNKTRRWWEF